MPNGLSKKKNRNDEYYVRILKNMYMYDVCVYCGRVYYVYLRYWTLVGSLNIMVIKS